MTISSTVACVLCESTENRFVSSTSVTTEQTDVSLKSAMKSLITGGMTMRTACGTMIRRSAERARHPERERRLHLPVGIAWRPAR